MNIWNCATIFFLCFLVFGSVHGESYSETPRQAVASAIQKWAEFSPDSPLDFKVPPFFKLRSEMRNLGMKESRSEMFYLGLLYHLASGDAFFLDDDESARLATADLSQLQDGFVNSEKHLLLMTWMLNQKDTSIFPDDFLFECLKITNGKVFHALLLGWDILSSGWEAYSKNKSLAHPRESFPKIQKLGVIPHSPGDLFSAWYHFWGVMIYAYHISSQTFGMPFVSESLSGIWVRGIAVIIDSGSMSFRNALQRANFAMKGAKAGNYLFRKSRTYELKRRASCIERIQKISS